MDALGLALKAAIIENNRTITEIAPKLGTTYDKLSNMINGRTPLDPLVLEGLRKELGKPKGWPLEDAGSLRTLSGLALRPIKVWGAISAGPGQATREPDKRDIYVPANMAGEDRGGFEIEGLSMYPNIHPGDVAVFKLNPIPRKGFVYFVRGCNSEPLIKEVQVSGGSMILHSFNPNYADMDLEEGMTTVGILIGLYRVVGSRETIWLDPHGLRFDDD